MTLACRYLKFAVCGLFFCCIRPGAAQPLERPASGTFDVVALRVEFQPDTSRFTSGEGTFEGNLYGDLSPKVDPLPHDEGYFQAHLDFLKHYVDRVSDGHVEVRTHLLPQIVRVPRQMGAYAPTGPDSDSDVELAKLARLVQDAWQQADDAGISGLVPGRTAFVLFHAGVGRDIELIGTTLDKTPQDLPSLFFDQTALARFGVAPMAFAGIPIDNALILPRTETRLGTDFIADEPFLLELSINGLLAASFFNFLGVPDLFDTGSGESAIGPFGLMDPQGFFAYRGLFPPEPTAWTKKYLGWVSPSSLTGDGPLEITLAAASIPQFSPVARFTVSNAEYFLVENRYRDPEGDGLTLQVWQHGQMVEQHVENGDPEFNSFVVDGFVGGVVVGVDNYDWALPGGLDEDDNELNGGILIWHVDERRLEAGLGDNTVNVGAETRAVDLEEADGAQDIGFPSGPFGPQADVGTPFDFFYKGNPVAAISTTGQDVRLYRNRFGPDTHPSSDTNAGGPSFIVLEDFSEPAATMTFVYRREAVDGIEPVDVGVPSPFGGSYGAGGGIVAIGDGIAVFSPNEYVFWRESGLGFRVWSGTFPAVADGLVVLATEPGAFSYSAIEVWKVAGGTVGIAQTFDLPESVQRLRPASPIVVANSAYNFLMRGGGQTSLIQVGTGGITFSPGEAVSLAAASGSLVLVGRQGTTIDENTWTYDLDVDAEVGQAVVGREKSGLLVAIPVTNRGELRMLLPNGDVETIDVAGAAASFGGAPGDSLSSYPVLADFDGDRHLDVLVAYGNLLIAFSQSGAIIRNFPIVVPAPVAAQPLLARFEGESDWSIFAAAANGSLYAYDTAERHRLRRGFPLEIGASAPATPLLVGDTLYAVSSDGYVKAWRLSGVETVGWGKLYKDALNSSYVELELNGEVDQLPQPLIDVSETYNWPNPIEDGVTHLRSRTSRDARVEITIIDAAGALVAEMDMENRAGVSNEVLWRADVESGLYFARFTAIATDGERASKLVKMAVIK